MTPNEERLVLELHSRWGNRWSRIAQKLPGRTDNEIKNYWRTHMRKRAQQKKKANSPASPSSPQSSNSWSSSASNSPTAEFPPVTEMKDRSFFDTGGLDFAAGTGDKKTVVEMAEKNKPYSMDEIWKYMEFSEESCNFPAQEVASSNWDYCLIDPLWSMDEEETKMLVQPVGDYLHSFPPNSLNRFV